MSIAPPRPTPIYNALVLVLGVLASYLALLSGGVVDRVAVLAYGVAALGILIYAAALIGPVKPEEARQNELDWTRWVTVSMAVLGVGVGILTYTYRPRLKALAGFLAWRVDTTNGAFLAGLIGLGLVMGFYVVRNWLKEEEEFVKSLTAVAGVAFLASIFGLAQQSQGGAANSNLSVNMMSAFANYFLGFTASALINLIIYALLTASYSATKSARSRALIFFLYGVDKAKLFDDYFLRNFENDKNYAKAHLVRALRELRARVLRVYAEKMEAKRRRFAALPAPQTFYRLISIEGLAANQPAAQAGGALKEEDKHYKVKLEEFAADTTVVSDMFRMGITIMLPDNLEYIVAPGEYKQPFPLRRSVAGLALAARQSIVMSRDRSRMFRDEINDTSVTPSQREAPRGFEEVNYLSYVSVPVVSRLGDQEEYPLGILNVDTTLFVAPPAPAIPAPAPPAAGAPPPPPARVAWGDGFVVGRRTDGGKVVVDAEMSPKSLREYAANIYDQNDDDAVLYLEEMKAIAAPLLELYLKCRQGAA
jgi:hypothetical protein